MFEMSESVGKLAEALAAAQGEMTTVSRDKTARIKPRDKPAYEYKYADLADVLDVARDPLAKHGIAVIQAPYMDDDGSIGVSTMLAHTSGEWMRSKLSHKMDLKKWQDMGAALTFLRRYCLSAMTGVASEDDTDAGDLKVPRQPARKPEPEPEPEPTWAEKSQKIADAVKSAATSEAVSKTLQVFQGDLQWLHDHKPHYYERLMQVAKEREDELRNVTPMAG